MRNIALLGILLLIAGCGGKSLTGTWSTEVSPLALTLNLKADGTFDGTVAGAGQPERKMKGTYKVEDKTITLTATEAGGKPVPAKAEPLVGTLADDMKSFDVPMIGKLTKK